MLYPSIDQLLSEVNENRFKIVLVVAQRARDLDDAKSKTNLESDAKSISIALQELAEKRITIIE